jgi:hypothetical protein
VNRDRIRGRAIGRPREAYVLGVRTWSLEVAVGPTGLEPYLVSHGGCVWPKGRRLEARCGRWKDAGDFVLAIDPPGSEPHGSPPPLDDPSGCRCGIYAVSHLEVPRYVPGPPMDLTGWEGDDGSATGGDDLDPSPVRGPWSATRWDPLHLAARFFGAQVHGYVALWGRVRTTFEGDVREWRGQFAYPQALVVEGSGLRGWISLPAWRRVLEQLARMYGVPLLDDWIWPTGVRA